MVGCVCENSHTAMRISNAYNSTAAMDIATYTFCWNFLFNGTLKYAMKTRTA